MTAAPSIVQLSRELASIVGLDHTSDDSALLKPFAIDGVRPSVSVSPASPEEISAILRIANEHKLNVVPCGGFTKQSLGATPEQIDILLRTERLNQTLHYDPGDLTIGVSAGARVGAVQQIAAADQLLFPLDVARPLQATIGGTLATASSGPLKHGYGGVREYCIGLSFVTGDGRIAKAGGRVVKNVAGYDLMKLLTGSHGTLGVIVSANFKLFPAPRQTRTFLAQFENIDEAVAFRRFIQRSPLSPMCLDIVSPLAHDYLGVAPSSGWTVALRAAGSDNVLSRYRRELGNSIALELHDEPETTFWRTVQDFSETIAGQHHNAMLINVHLPTTDVANALRAVQQISSDHNFVFAAVGRFALASLVLALIPIAVDPPSVMQYADVVSALRASIARDAAAIVQRCPLEVKEHVSVWGSSTNDVKAMQAVKRVLDPNDILNRGRFLF